MESITLAGILTKIAFRMEWEEWDLTAEEYDILDSASGQEIAYTAYEKGLPIVTMLRNADELVDIHNEREQKNILRILNELKLDLMSDFPREKKTIETSLTTEDIERRLIEETINEIVGISPPAMKEQSDKIQIEIQAKHKMKDKNVENITFASKLESTGSRLEPSLIREIEQGASNITLNELVPTPIQFIELSEGFPEASAEEVAEAGHFSTPYGQRLYKSMRNLEEELKRKKKHEDSSKLMDHSLPILPSFADKLETAPPQIPSINITDVSLPLPQPIEMDSSLQVPQQHEKETSTSQAIVKDKTPVLDAPEEYQPIPVPLTEEEQPAVEMEVAAVGIPEPLDTPQSFFQNKETNIAAPATTEDARRSTESFDESRRELFEKIVLQSPSRVQQKVVKNQRRVVRSPEKKDEEILEFNKYLIFHKHKPKPKGPPNLPPICIPLHLNFDPFKDIENYQSDYGESDVEEEDQYDFIDMEPDNLDAVTAPQHVTEAPTKQILRDSTAHRKESNIIETFITPKAVPKAIEQSTSGILIKRRRLTEEKENRIDSSEELLQRTGSTPGERFQPRITSTVQAKERPSLLRVPLETMEYNRLQLISDRSMQQNVSGEPLEKEKTTEQPSIELMPVPDINVEDVPSELPPVELTAPKIPTNGPIYFRKVEVDGDDYIRFAVNGVVQQHDQFFLDTVGLYMQIRFIMKERECWKLKFNDLLPLVSLVNETTEHIIKMRLWFLEDEKYVKLTWSEDEKDIIEVEIPIAESV
ncbi:CLUMA_CG008124, isoform A [Clunio marinus]|uniref:CLUMA_CG008124, isoform A n=1 Tax=Clunio marinus TaxID=568069 RepID=A0A1J1I2T6_9DIPT|nr:CLUMA_CG008124, isoform A [Clunio marinus]